MNRAESEPAHILIDQTWKTSSRIFRMYRIAWLNIYATVPNSVCCLIGGLNFDSFWLSIIFREKLGSQRRDSIIVSRFNHWYISRFFESIFIPIVFFDLNLVHVREAENVQAVWFVDRRKAFFLRRVIRQVNMGKICGNGTHNLRTTSRITPPVTQ